MKEIRYKIKSCGGGCPYRCSIEGSWACSFDNRNPRRIVYEELVHDKFPKWCPLPDEMDKVKEVVKLLNEMEDLNPELMEDILEKVGMRERVIDKVLDSEKYIVAEKVWDDIYNNETLTYDNFPDYYHDKLL